MQLVFSGGPGIDEFCPKRQDRISNAQILPCLNVTETDGRLFFGIVIYMECVPGREENFTPKLVFRLEERIGFNELDGQPLCLNEVDVRQDLFNLVMSGERVLPIVLVAPLTASRWDQNLQPRYLLDISALASHLNGYARIIRFSRILNSEWTYCVGTKWAVFDGAVRILNPGFDIEHRQMNHPLFTKDKIQYCESRDGDGARMFFASLCARIKRQITETEMNFSEVVFLREAKRLLRIVEQILRVSPDSLNGASLLSRGNAELPGKRLEMHEALEEYKKLYGELPQKEPETPVVSAFSEMVRWCEDVLAGKLVLHPQAETGLSEARYRHPELVCRALLLLANDWRDSRLGLENKFNEKCNELGLEFLSSRRNGHLFTSGKDWFLEYPAGSGKMEFLHYQLRKGCAKTPLRCMRIYFWWNDAEKMVVVGHLPTYIEKGGS